MAFNLSSCPSGWKASDGTNGTVDLRGYFVRGLGTNSDGTASGALGVKVTDDLKSHTHGVTMGSFRQVSSGSGGIGFNDTTLTSTQLPVSSTGGTETRPKNIALLYCQKI